MEDQIGANSGDFLQDQFQLLVTDRSLGASWALPVSVFGKKNIKNLKMAGFCQKPAVFLGSWILRAFSCLLISATRTFGLLGSALLWLPLCVKAQEVGGCRGKCQKVASPQHLLAGISRPPAAVCVALPSSLWSLKQVSQRMYCACILFLGSPFH